MIRLNKIILDLKKTSRKKNLFSGFVISNTSKKFNDEYFFTPIRETKNIIFAGAVIYSEKKLKQLIKKIDGKVDYIFLDAEKKISSKLSNDGVTANIERSGKEMIKKSKILIFKANDLTLDAIDIFLSQITLDDIRGMGNKKITILGAGNLGSKLALRLVERGANVCINRRNKKNLSIITKALNLIKPKNTDSKVKYILDKYKASKGADILISTNTGEKIIDEKIVKSLKSNSIILDAGKGTIHEKALALSIKRKIKIFRADVTAAFHGLTSALLETEKTIKKNLGRKIIDGFTFVSGGLLAAKNELVVNDINNPKYFYGIGDGHGDFLRKIDFNNKKYKKVNQLIKKMKLK